VKEEAQRPEDGSETGPAPAGKDSRPQKGGEGGTTRFGMEEGDNTDVPATGLAEPDEEESEPKG
jgi:hypothetical protein